MAESEIQIALRTVLERIRLAVEKRPKNLKVEPTLVAVSKTKPKELVIEAYNCGQKHFGENYVKELVEKGTSQEIFQTCPEIKWHFIGHLQRNKIPKLVSVPRLYMVETIDSLKLADTLDGMWSKLTSEKLKVMVQVNTSGEENKSGVEPSNALELVRHVMENCPHLELCGLMTIGAFDHDYSQGPNPDFVTLVRCREEICRALNMDENNLQLSMGMSQDFEQAIEAGSTNVRIGTTIFGTRQYPQK